jgi:hypothetical protein
MPDEYEQPYTFSTHIGAACAKQMRTFADLAEKLKAMVKGLAKELEIDESFLTRLAEEGSDRPW